MDRKRYETAQVDEVESMSPAKWKFEEYDEDRANLSGLLSDLVKNVTLEHPGVLGLGAYGIERPSNEASLLVREAVQNSWDNARERANAEGVVPDCHLEFRFLELRNQEKVAFVEAAGLHELANRTEQLPKVKQGLADPKTYEKLDDPDHPLRIMQLVEVSGTTGMYGPWTGKKSRLNLAMLNVGFTKKAEGSGGSYGYGKVGLIRCSGVRVVAAYTAFNANITDGSTTYKDDTDRRFIGVNYWEDHDLDDVEFTGWARLGSGQNRLKPFEGDEADEMARGFQMDVRDPTKTSGGGGIGTTLAVLDPIVEPKDVVLAVERYWWPALVDSNWTLEISVMDYSGEELRPSPRTNPDLAPFVEAHQWLQTNPEDKKRKKYLPNEQLPESGRTVKPGVVSLIWEDTDDSWTWPSDEDTTEHRSLIALCRSPRMVVAYLDCGGNKPFLRGVFINGDDETNTLLTQTEAGMHVEWNTAAVSPAAAGSDAHHLAKEVKKHIKSRVGAARRALIRPARTTSRSHLPELARFMRKFFGGAAGTKRRVENVQEHRTISVQFPEPAEPETRPGGVCSVAAISFEPMPKVVVEAPFEVQIEITYRIQEDGRGGSPWPCKVTAPSGFAERRVGETVILEGTLSEKVVLQVESAGHDAEWTGEWDPVANRVGQKGGPSDGQ